jgi:hypothetical protein
MMKRFKLKLLSISLGLGMILTAGLSITGIGLSTTASYAQSPSWWEKLLNPTPPQKSRRRGSKGDICLVAPATLDSGQPMQVWGDKPLFVWQGLVERLEVTDAQGQVAWKSEERLERQSVVYAGTPLESEQVYELTVYEGDTPTMFQRFQRVSVPEQTRIATELVQLQQELEQRGYGAQELALARTNYFAEQGLWVDAFVELEAHRQGSKVLEQYQIDAQKSFCG